MCARYRYEVAVTQVSPIVKVWPSAPITSNVSQNVPISTDALPADATFQWCVRYWDAQGAPSPWSVNATFSTGLSTQADWAGAKWVGTGSMAQLRKEFANAKKTIVQAFVYIVGLGYYKLHVNGMKISNHV